MSDARQFVLRLPEYVRDKIEHKLYESARRKQNARGTESDNTRANATLVTKVVRDPNSTHDSHFVFEVDSEKYYATMVRLPCMVESMKTFAGKGEYYKTGDFQHALIVHEEVYGEVPRPPMPSVSNDGLSEATANIVSNVFDKRKIPVSRNHIDAVEAELFKALNPKTVILDGKEYQQDEYTELVDAKPIMDYFPSDVQVAAGADGTFMESTKVTYDNAFDRYASSGAKDRMIERSTPSPAPSTTPPMPLASATPPMFASAAAATAAISSASAEKEKLKESAAEPVVAAGASEEREEKAASAQDSEEAKKLKSEIAGLTSRMEKVLAKANKIKNAILKRRQMNNVANIKMQIQEKQKLLDALSSSS